MTKPKHLHTTDFFSRHSRQHISTRPDHTTTTITNFGDESLSDLSSASYHYSSSSDFSTESKFIRVPKLATESIFCFPNLQLDIAGGGDPGSGA